MRIESVAIIARLIYVERLDEIMRLHVAGTRPDAVSLPGRLGSGASFALASPSLARDAIVTLSTDRYDCFRAKA
ncbi:hypothetical protein ACE5IS_15030, partial [Leptospira wolffii]